MLSSASVAREPASPIASQRSGREALEEREPAHQRRGRRRDGARTPLRRGTSRAAHPACRAPRTRCATRRAVTTSAPRSRASRQPATRRRFGESPARCPRRSRPRRSHNQRATSSTLKASLPPSISRSCPCPRRRSIWNGGCRRPEITTWSRGRRMPAERFDEPGRRARRRELVRVVDDEHEVGGELLVQHLRQLRGERVGAEELLQLGTTGALGEPAHVAGDVRHAQAERVAELPSEGGQVEVVVIGGVPGARSLLPPRRQHRGLTESRLCHDHREAAISCRG